MSQYSDKGTAAQALMPRMFNHLISSLNAIGSLWIFLLMLLINADAMGRTFFTAPIDGVIEMVELSLVGIVFLQLGDAARQGRLTRSDGFFNFVSLKYPAIGRVMGALFDGLSMVFMAIILYGSVPLLIESWQHDYFVGNEGVFTAPVWPAARIKPRTNVVFPAPRWPNRKTVHVSGRA